jgi:hypothetical protein
LGFYCFRNEFHGRKYFRKKVYFLEESNFTGEVLHEKSMPNFRGEQEKNEISR